jgi:hypothetical protein
MSENTFHATIPIADPDAVYKSVRLANGVRSWSGPAREQFQLGHATIEVHAHNHPDNTDWAMVVTAGSEADVRDTLARLRFDPATEITDMKPRVTPAPVRP